MLPAFLAVAVIAAAGLGDNRPTTAPAPASQPIRQPAAQPAAQPTTRPSAAQIAEARAMLAKALAPAATLTDADRKRIARFLVELGNPVWKVREKASAGLMKFGPETLPLLMEAANSKDLEVADRVGVAIKTIQEKTEDVGTELDPAIDTLATVGDKRLIGMLIRLLDHPGRSARYSAEYALRRLTAQSFGFNTNDEPAARAKAAAKWRACWKTAAASFSYDKARIKPQNLALLITNDGSKSVTAVTLRGKPAWTKRMRTTLYCATGLPNGNIIVGYVSAPKNVEEYTPDGKAVWAPVNVPSGTGGVFDIERLANGNTLIAYTHAGHVTEIDRKGKVVWKKASLRSPISAQRLNNGNTLIAEHSGGRVIEVDRAGKVVWQKTGLKSPCDAVKLRSGNVLIGEYSGKRVLEVDRQGKIIWQRACPAAVSGVCRLPDGTTALTNKTEGAILVGRDGKKIRQLLTHNGAWGKIRLVPTAVLKPRKK